MSPAEGREPIARPWRLVPRSSTQRLPRLLNERGRRLSVRGAHDIVTAISAAGGATVKR